MLSSFLPVVRERLARAARTVPFRLGVAAACLVVQFVVMLQSGDRFGAPFNAAPGQPPAFVKPATDAEAQRWNRLVTSRWDSGQYIGLGLRGYDHCPPRDPQGKLPLASRACNLAFYPTYAMVGRAVSLGGRIPIDYALLAVSLVSSFLFLFLWTGDALVSRLGLLETYVALLVMNAFTTAWSFVAIQTEPLTLVLALGAFVCFARRWWLAAALLAGAATSVRITGVAVGAACGLALAVETWQSRPPTRAAWARRLGTIALCGWGAFVLCAYHYHRFGDPLAYIHTHGQHFKHEPSLLALLHPKPEWLVFSMENPLHEGVWLVGTLLWFLIGHREALGRFSPAQQVFWYALFFGTLGIAATGLVSLGFIGMNRYLLLALPLFFAISASASRRPLLLAFWLIVSGWHYWNADGCHYSGGPGNHSLQVCHSPHWVGRL